MTRHDSKPHLLIIPGLGDRAWLYQAVVPIWRLHGYKVSIHRFGWNDTESTLFEKEKLLQRHIDRLSSSNLYIVGASAGGVAALNALEERPNVHKVITIASPLQPNKNEGNNQLFESSTRAASYIEHWPSQVLEKITSIYGICDTKVPARLSIHSKIRNIQLSTPGHAMTIFLSLTFYSILLQNHLRGSSRKSRRGNHTQ